MGILLVILIKCMAGILRNEPYYDITVVAKRATKEKQSSNLTSRCAYVTRGKLGAILNIYLDSINLFAIDLL